MGSIATPPADCQPLVDSLLPCNSVHLLGGAPGAGKTCLAAVLLRQLQDGVPVFGYACHPPTALAVIAADRGWKSHAQWFDAVGLGTIPHYSLHDDPHFRWDRLKHPDGWLAVLLEALAKVGPLPRRALVVVDPLGPFLGGDALNYGRSFAALGELGQYCVTHGVTILGTAHAGKQRGGRQFQYTRPQDRILGTTALTGCADTVMYLATPEETRTAYWELHWAPHHAPSASCRLQRNEEGLFEVATIPPASFKPRHELVLRLIVEAGAEGLRAQAIVDQAAAHGVSRAGVFRSLRELAEVGGIASCGSHRWRAVPPN